MAMVIKNNLVAQSALGELKKNNDKLGKDLKKVASGMRVNGAGDDASSYAISERMRVQLRGLEQDNANAQNATSLLKTAAGAIGSTVDLLKTMKEKAINAANDTNTDADRATIQKELDQGIDQLDDNANVTFNNKILFDGAADAATDVKQTIVKGLNSEWIDASLQLIKDTYGISFADDTASVKQMNLLFENSGPDVLAYVRSYFSGNKTSKLELSVNMDFYNKLKQTDPNGYTSASAGYLDRTLAHEFTHAVMSTNIRNFSSLPKWLREGAAEYTHGIDDFRVVALSKMTANTIDSDADEDPYVAGYAFLHYLNKANGYDGMAMKRLMATLVKEGGTSSGLDDAIAAATKGKFSTSNEAIAAFKADFAAAKDVRTFLKDSCDIDMSDQTDTGSATGSKSAAGDAANGEDIVLEGKSTSYWWYPSGQQTTIEGLTMDWGDYPQPALSHAGFRFQVGTKANQNILAAFSDIHADALGLKSAEGETLSVQTRPAAKRALTIFDRAIRKALDQATTIGALTSRLDYTSRNLTTASENVQASESTIRDADMAKEMTEYTKSNVLAQAAQSMLAQANQSSSGVLSLLQ
ncbi:flagellinolysin [uncultured Selenomonas sp.]|uniref:flagellinolysin n=1 Tax=uncultured Selenomonas sp. TaxID=159275 RepID=UPI0025EEB2CC|nr:flagellinolysin [uncultured Selenomonas sp.]